MKSKGGGIQNSYKKIIQKLSQYFKYFNVLAL